MRLPDVRYATKGTHRQRAVDGEVNGAGNILGGGMAQVPMNGEMAGYVATAAEIHCGAGRNYDIASVRLLQRAA